MCILKYELGQQPNTNLAYFWKSYFPHFVSILSNQNGCGCAKSRSKNLFALEKQNDNYSDLNYFFNLNIHSLAYIVVVANELQLRYN
jgi:hypothetical protein